MGMQRSDLLGSASNLMVVIIMTTLLFLERPVAIVPWLRID